MLSPKQQELTDRKTAIIALCKEGYLVHQIVEKLDGLSLETVRQTVRALVNEGVISKPTRKPGSGGMVPSVEDIESDRVKTILTLRKKMAPMRVVGEALGLSTQRVHQLIGDIEKKHGPQVLVSERPVFTVVEASLKTGLSYGFILSCCKSGKVPCRTPDLKLSTPYLLEQAGIVEIEKLHAKGIRRRCVVCRRRFSCTFFSKKKMCSKKCRCQRHEKVRHKLFRKKTSLDSLVFWHRQLYERLQSYTLPEGDRWVVVTGAVKLSKLSRTQIWYLAVRRIVTLRRHPTQISRVSGKHIRLYSASQMKIAGQVYADYLAKKKAS